MNPPSTFVIARPKTVAIHRGKVQKLDRLAALAMTERCSWSRVQFQPDRNRVLSMNPPSTFVIARPKAVAIHRGKAQELDRRATLAMTERCSWARMQFQPDRNRVLSMNPPATFVFARPKAVAIHRGKAH